MLQPTAQDLDFMLQRPEAVAQGLQLLLRCILLNQFSQIRLRIASDNDLQGLMDGAQAFLPHNGLVPLFLQIARLEPLSLQPALPGLGLHLNFRLQAMSSRYESYTPLKSASCKEIKACLSGIAT